MARNGYLLLGGRGYAARDTVERHLADAGLDPAGGDDRPALVLLIAQGGQASKKDWFEAGVWCGDGAILLVFGERLSQGRRALVGRLGGFAVHEDAVEGLPAALARLTAQLGMAAKGKEG